MPPPVKTEPLAPQLHVWDVAAITAGIIIGAGIYESTWRVAANVGGAWQLLLMWIVGGIIALAGACCYAELSSAYPHQGGTYVFLKRGIGDWAGFLYVWCEFWVVRPANIGVMAFVFAKYASSLVPSLPSYIIAAAVVLVLGAMNMLGVRVGKGAQLALTLVKVVGLVAVFLVGITLPVPVGSTQVAPENFSTNYSLALVFILFAYGGWNETAAVAAEVRNPQRNMLRGLLLGTLIVVATYMMINVALLRGLAWSGLNVEHAPAARLMLLALGKWGEHGIGILICISCLGAINAMLFTGSRIYYALGKDEPAFAWLGRWHQQLGTPVRALALQTLIALVFIPLFGWKDDGFENLVIFSTPIFFSFMLLASSTVTSLRVVEPNLPRPFRLPLFPLEPLLFEASSALMIYSSISYMLGQKRDVLFWYRAAATFLPVLVGVAVYFLMRRFRTHAPNLDD